MVTPKYLEAIVEQGDLQVDEDQFQADLGNETLDVQLNVLWVGRIWCGAYSYWRNRIKNGFGKPWEDHHVAIVGRVKPRGAASAVVCAKNVLEIILKAGGAEISDASENLTFAVCGGGTQREDVLHLLKSQTVCLGVGFVVDIIVRGFADATEYLFFQEQKPLLAPPIMRHSRYGTPITKKQLELSKKKIKHISEDKPYPRPEPIGAFAGGVLEKDRTDVKTCANKPEQLQDGDRKKLDKTYKSGDDDNEVNRSEEEQLRRLYPTRIRIRPSKKRPRRKTADALQSSQQHQPPGARNTYTGGSTLDAKLDMSASPETSEKILNWRPRKEPVAEFDSPVSKERRVRPSRVPSSPPPSEQVTPLKRSKRRRKNPDTSIELIDLCTTSPTTIPKPRRSKEGNRTCMESSGHVSNGEQPSKRRRTDENQVVRNVRTTLNFDSPCEQNRESPNNEENHPKDCADVELRDAECHQRMSSCVEISDEEEDTIRRGRARSQRIQEDQKGRTGKEAMDISSHRNHALPNDSNESVFDIVSEAALPCLATDSKFSDYLVAKGIQSIDDGYHFMIDALGGRYSDKHVTKVLGISSPGLDAHSTSESDSRKSSSQQRKNNPRNPKFNFDESPGSEDCNGTYKPDVDEISFGLPTDLVIDCTNGQELRSSRLHRGNDLEISGQPLGGASQYSQYTGFDMQVPKGLISFRSVLSSMFLTVEGSNNLHVTVGNCMDDEACQDKVQFSEWIIGAERGIGSSSHWNEDVEHTSLNSSASRMIAALIESQAINSFATPGRISSSQTSVLCGICIRLLTAPILHDYGGSLLEKLLTVRNDQSQRGFDSLEIVISARDFTSVSRNHNALATVWAALVYREVQVLKRKSIWRLFNNIWGPRLDELFSISHLAGNSMIEKLRKGTMTLIDSCVAVSFAHALRADCLEIGSDADTPVGFHELCPDNWHIISEFIKRLKDRSGRVSEKAPVDDILFLLLSLICTKVAGRLWNVSENFLGSVSNAIASVQKPSDQTCFCTSPSLFVSNFHVIGKIGCDQGSLLQHLKTPCDCYFYLGWLFCTNAGVNPMRNAMQVIRHGALLMGTGTSDRFNPQYINHHVGLTLAVADSLGSANANGEYALCRTLTSKCGRLDTLLKNTSGNRGQNIVRWKTTLEAIFVRCRTLIAKEKSIHCYTNWIRVNVLTGIRAVRKNGQKKGCSVRDREELRVRESTFADLSSLAVQSLHEIFSLMITEAAHDRTARVDMIGEFLKNSERCIPGFTEYAKEAFATMEANGGESVNKTRTVLLAGIITALVDEVTLFTCDLTRASCNSALRDMHVRRNTIIKDSGLERLFKQIIATNLLRHDVTLAYEVKKCAARGLCLIWEVHGAVGGNSYSAEERQKVEDCIEDIFTTSRLPQFQPGSQVAEASSDFWRKQGKIELHFWCEALRQNWCRRVIEHKSRIWIRAMKAIVMGMGYLMYESASKELNDMVSVAVRNMETLTQVKGLLEECRKRTGDHGDEWNGVWELRVLKNVILELAVRWGKESMDMIEGLDLLMTDVIRCSVGWESVGKAVAVHADLFMVSRLLRSDWRGNNRDLRRAGPPLQSWLETISNAVTKLQRKRSRDRQEEMELMLEDVQESMMGALGTIEVRGRDVELRVRVMRVVKSFAQYGWTLGGFWKEPRESLRFVQGEQVKKYQRQVVEWQKIVFQDGVESPLRSMDARTSYVEVRQALMRLLEVVEASVGQENQCGTILAWMSRQCVTKLNRTPINLRQNIEAFTLLKKIQSRLDQIV